MATWTNKTTPTMSTLQTANDTGGNIYYYTYGDNLYILRSVSVNHHGPCDAGSASRNRIATKLGITMLTYGIYMGIQANAVYDDYNYWNGSSWAEADGSCPNDGLSWFTV